jgi:hypothetical protein
VDNTSNLFSVDLTTATATPIGFTGQFLQGLADLRKSREILKVSG